MFTSLNNRGTVARSARRYALATLGCVIFSAVYEYFSHEVYSPWMVGLFLVPLVFGAVPMALLARARMRVGWLARQLWACAVLTLTLGCCFAGVLEIYGTTSPWLPTYLVASAPLALSALLAAKWHTVSGK